MHVVRDFELQSHNQPDAESTISFLQCVCLGGGGGGGKWGARGAVGVEFMFHH